MHTRRERVSLLRLEYVLCRGRHLVPPESWTLHVDGCFILCLMTVQHSPPDFFLSFMLISIWTKCEIGEGSRSGSRLRGIYCSPGRRLFALGQDSQIEAAHIMCIHGRAERVFREFLSRSSGRSASNGENLVNGLPVQCFYFSCRLVSNVGHVSSRYTVSWSWSMLVHSIAMFQACYNLTRQ